MNLLNFLKGISTSTLAAKLSHARDAGKITLPEESMIPASAENAKEKQALSVARLTIPEAKQRLVDVCNSYIGTHEAPDGSNSFANGIWDVKLYGFDGRNVPWCDIFSDYCYIECFGYDLATRMTYQNPNGFAACQLSAEAYQRNNAWFSYPELCDQIFFYSGGGINHIGIVVSVDGDQITCVEGNYSNSVAKTYYNWKISKQIAGFGRPDWSLVAEPEQQIEIPDFSDVDDTQFDIIHPEHRKTYLHLKYGDGKNRPLPQVLAWQNLLLCSGIKLPVFGADGEYGLETEKATLQWQKQVKDLGADVEVNGIVDEDDWEEIIRVDG